MGKPVQPGGVLLWPQWGSGSSWPSLRVASSEGLELDPRPELLQAEAWWFGLQIPEPSVDCGSSLLAWGPLEDRDQEKQERTLNTMGCSPERHA